MIRHKWAGIVLALFLFVLIGEGITEEHRKQFTPSPKDKCPVCGMFVAKYPDWTAQIVFKDGSVFFFDGAKDMFKFYFNIKRYSPKRNVEDIAAILVTDYYSLVPVDGFSSLYVIGSDVYGPMGRELIPFGKKKEAEEFKTDHKGREILRFREITPAIVKGLD